ILLSGGLLCALAWLLRDPILFRLFSIPIIYAEEAATAFGLMLLATLTALISPAFSSLLIGAQRTDGEKQVAGAANILLSLGMLAALLAGFSVRGLAAAQLAANLFGLAAYVVLAHRILPNVPLQFIRRIDFAEAWRLLRFGGGLQLTQM